MDLGREIRKMVEYILPEECVDEDVINNYVDTFKLIFQEYLDDIVLVGHLQEWKKENSSVYPLEMEWDRLQVVRMLLAWKHKI